MKAARLLLILCLFATQQLSAQVLFSERSSYNFASALFASMVRIGDTIYLSGVASDTSQNFAQVQSPKNFVAMMDINGNNISHHIVDGEFGKKYETFDHTLIKTSDNGFALAGSTIDTDGYKALLIKYDSAMNVEFIKEFEYPDSIIFLEETSIVQMKDGSFIVAGDIQYASFLSSIAAVKIDSSYNVMWWQAYNSQGLFDGYPALLQLNDTALLVGCEHNNELNDPYAVISNTRFMIIDTAGNLLNEWQDTNDSTFAPYGLLKTRDGGYAYCGRYTVRMSAPYDVVFTNGVIAKLDSNFHLQWRWVSTNTTTMGSNTILNQLYELPDGALIATGGGTNLDSATAQGFSGWIVKVAANGDSIWSRMYEGVTGVDNENQINDFQLLPDGGIIACGTSTDFSVNYASQQAWLIRLDSMGCLIPGCDTITATGLNPALTDGNHTGIAVYPNPTSSLVYLLIKTDNPTPDLSFKIYDIAGRLMATEQGALADVTYLLHVNNYTNGMYFVQVMNGENVVAQSRFVKQ